MGSAGQLFRHWLRVSRRRSVCRGVINARLSGRLGLPAPRFGATLPSVCLHALRAERNKLPAPPDNVICYLARSVLVISRLTFATRIEINVYGRTCRAIRGGQFLLPKIAYS